MNLKAKPPKGKRIPSAPLPRQGVDKGNNSEEIVVNSVVVDNTNEIAALRSEIERLQAIHAAETQQFKNRLQALESAPKLTHIPLESTILESGNNHNELKTMQNKLIEFGNSLKEFDTRMEKMQVSITSCNSKIEELKEKVDKQREELEQMIHDLADTLKTKIEQLREEILSQVTKFKSIIDNQQLSLTKDVTTLMATVEKLKEEMKRVKAPEMMKEHILPYVEKLAPVDLFEIDWTNYQYEKKDR
ncbi:unnamed protein product [Rotaria sp. Silwood2]|nr:unnamed protein product [Rotaria sp. Silwood2]CAF4279264.1 unnamed protein product [Rotaria sp. Silwood2]